MLMKKIPAFLLVLLFSINAFPQLLGQWRGLDRSGVYPETGLLTEWPKDGPPLLWSTTNLPAGHSSATVIGDTIYITGTADTNEVLLALNHKGAILWQTPYGRAWKKNYKQSRATPTVDGGKIYISTGVGDLACVSAEEGKVIWQAKAFEDFEGTCGWWGLAESVLIHKDKVFINTGGKKTAIVAYDKNDGRLAWQSETLSDKASMASPLLIDRGGKRQIVSLSEKYIFGVDPDNGKIVWKFDFGALMFKENNHAITPLYENGRLYVTSGYDHQSVMLQLSEDASSVSLLWTNGVLDAHIGGVVKIGNCIYGSNFLSPTSGNWVCVDWQTGQVKWETPWICKGSIIAADGRLYCYEEKTGNLALVKPSPEKFDLVSSLKVPFGSGPYYAHPVIKNGVLYLRHGEALLAYDIKRT
jgi:outer membrane protein assembly factor BamB